MIKYNKELIESKTPAELGITYPSYWNILEGKEVTMKVLLRIANSLNVSLKELIRYEKEN